MSSTTALPVPSSISPNREWNLRPTSFALVAVAKNMPPVFDMISFACPEMLLRLSDPPVRASSRVDAASPYPRNTSSHESCVDELVMNRHSSGGMI